MENAQCQSSSCECTLIVLISYIVLVREYHDKILRERYQVKIFNILLYFLIDIFIFNSQLVLFSHPIGYCYIIYLWEKTFLMQPIYNGKNMNVLVTGPRSSNFCMLTWVNCVVYDRFPTFMLVCAYSCKLYYSLSLKNCNH